MADQKKFQNFSAWFADDIDSSCVSQWLENGGSSEDNVLMADYIFSYNAKEEAIKTAWAENRRPFVVFKPTWINNLINDQNDQLENHIVIPNLKRGLCIDIEDYDEFQKDEKILEERWKDFEKKMLSIEKSKAPESPNIHSVQKRRRSNSNNNVRQQPNDVRTRLGNNVTIQVSDVTDQAIDDTEQEDDKKEQSRYSLRSSKKKCVRDESMDDKEEEIDFRKETPKQKIKRDREVIDKDVENVRDCDIKDRRNLDNSQSPDNLIKKKNRSSAERSVNKVKKTTNQLNVDNQENDVVEEKQGNHNSVLSPTQTNSVTENKDKIKTPVHTNAESQSSKRTPSLSGQFVCKSNTSKQSVSGSEKQMYSFLYGSIEGIKHLDDLDLPHMSLHEFLPKRNGYRVGLVKK